jgi:hypothetical protein
MNNDLNDEQEILLAKEEIFFLQEEETSKRLNSKNNPNKINIEHEVKLLKNPLENNQLPLEKIATEVPLKGLYHLNKNLARVAKQLASQPDLNGLFLSGLIIDSFTQIADPFFDLKIDKQAAGVAVINRLREIVPDRFVGDSQEPFLWKDPYFGGGTYKFEVQGGDLIQEDGKTKLMPKHLKAKELNSANEVFQASSLDNRTWHIQKCDFSALQLKSLIQAENILQKQNNEKELTKMHQKQSLTKALEALGIVID